MELGVDYFTLYRLEKCLSVRSVKKLHFRKKKKKKKTTMRRKKKILSNHERIYTGRKIDIGA